MHLSLMFPSKYKSQKIKYKEEYRDDPKGRYHLYSFYERREHTRSSPEVNVWCGISKFGVRGPPFCNDQTLTGDSNLDILSVGRRSAIASFGLVHIAVFPNCGDKSLGDSRLSKI
ncbi:hypothetical protein ABEB36_000344 [Hypothenemus hampei]|uniref:Uncharacterized protein n=1 Tax=Hypothenemus hampei TaxID=57062 RepID=A0ABD1FAZ5_HYPHA